MNTIQYKSGFIHENLSSGMIQVQVDRFAYPVEIKSFHAAKLLISKHIKKYGGGK